MVVALTALGIIFLAYGALMAALYPAGGFFLVWVALGAALLVASRVERARFAICAAFVVGAIVVGGLSALIATTAAVTPPAGVDCLVVLGAGLRPDGYPSETLRFRLEAALAYLDENPGTSCIVSGGQGFGEPLTEADAMAEYLEARGLDGARITKEGRSGTTVENVRNSSVLLAPDATVAIVTNDFHLYRALRIAKKNGLPGAYGLAARTNPLYLPQATLRECAAIVKETLTGNM